MNVTLDRAYARMVHDRIRSGRHASPAEVAQAGLHALESCEQDRILCVTKLGRKLAEGAQRRPIPYSRSLLEEVRAKAWKADAA